jgi:Carboxypeptidase regulatory-like domain
MGLKSLLAALAAMVLACAAFAFDENAESGVRAVEGIVSAADSAPVDGAVVQLKDTRTLQIRSFVTKEDGAYRFAGLSTNDEYEIRAEHNGASSTRRLDIYDQRKVARINLRLSK